MLSHDVLHRLVLKLPRWQPVSRGLRLASQRGGPLCLFIARLDCSKPFVLARRGGGSQDEELENDDSVASRGARDRAKFHLHQNLELLANSFTAPTGSDRSGRRRHRRHRNLLTPNRADLSSSPWPTRPETKSEADTSSHWPGRAPGLSGSSGPKNSRRAEAPAGAHLAPSRLSRALTGARCGWLSLCKQSPGRKSGPPLSSIGPAGPRWGRRKRLGRSCLRLARSLDAAVVVAIDDKFFSLSLYLQPTRSLGSDKFRSSQELGASGSAVGGNKIIKLSSIELRSMIISSAS